MPIAAHSAYWLPVATLSEGRVMTTEAPGVSWPTRIAVEFSVTALPLGAVASFGTTEAAAQI